jgi:hypothetical protein
VLLLAEIRDHKLDDALVQRMVVSIVELKRHAMRTGRQVLNDDGNTTRIRPVPGQIIERDVQMSDAGRNRKRRGAKNGHDTNVLSPILQVYLDLWVVQYLDFCNIPIVWVLLSSQPIDPECPLISAQPSSKTGAAGCRNPSTGDSSENKLRAHRLDHQIGQGPDESVHPVGRVRNAGGVAAHLVFKLIEGAQMVHSPLLVHR